MLVVILREFYHAQSNLRLIKGHNMTMGDAKSTDIRNKKHNEHAEDQLVLEGSGNFSLARAGEQNGGIDGRLYLRIKLKLYII